MSSTDANTETTSTADYLKNNVFTATNFLYFVWFLGIYLIIYFLVSPDKHAMGRTINIILVVWLIYLCSYVYFSMSEDQKQNLWRTMVDWTQIYFNDDNELLWIVLSTIVFYILIYVLNVPMDAENKPFMVELIESKLWIMMVTFIIIFFFKYVLKINIVDIFFEWFNKLTSGGVDLIKKVVPDKIKAKYNNSSDVSGVATSDVSGGAAAPHEEVFNVSNNLYSYSDAQEICKSMNARLATYDDIEAAYNNGAEWCAYGWSEGQMAYFPTQKATWDKLQKNPKHKNDCGRPGVNGGYIGNPEFKFGVNCYGVKPKASQADLDMMNARKQIPAVAKTEEEIALEKKIKYWMDNSANLLKINSYNGERWSRY